VKIKNQLVCKVKKSLYELKKFPRMWYEKVDTYILGPRFTRRKFDRCVYLNLLGNHFIYVVLYVDYMFLIGNNKNIEVKTQLSCKFYMRDIGSANFILVMEIKRD
jgi:hypothetical protein